MELFGMHISLWMLIVGILVYFINITIVNHYIKVKAYQIQQERRMERRRTSERRDVKQDEKLMKEVPKLKWTVPLGFAAFLSAIIGGLWALLRMFGIIKF